MPMGGVRRLCDPAARGTGDPVVGTSGRYGQAALARENEEASTDFIGFTRARENASSGRLHIDGGRAAPYLAPGFTLLHRC